MIKFLRLPLCSILLLGGLVFQMGCTPQGDTTTESTDDTTTTDTTTTDTTTTVVYNQITVTAPNGGETWNQGSTYTITWEKGTREVKADYIGLHLYDGSGDAGTLIHTILADPEEEEKEAVKANDGSYSWTIPADIPIGSNYEVRIRAKNEDGNLEEDESNTKFTISTEGELSFETAAFSDGGEIPLQYTCDGSDTKLTFSVSGVPSDAERLIVFIDDLDGTPTSTTTDSDWNHWVLFNIPVVSSISGYSLPSGAVEGTTSSGSPGFDSLCPDGETGDRKKHNYRFELYAIDTTLSLGPESNRAAVVTAMKDNLLEKTSFKGYFGSN